MDTGGAGELGDHQAEGDQHLAGERGFDSSSDTSCQAFRLDILTQRSTDAIQQASGTGERSAKQSNLR